MGCELCVYAIYVCTITKSHVVLFGSGELHAGKTVNKGHIRFLSFCCVFLLFVVLCDCRSGNLAA